MEIVWTYLGNGNRLSDLVLHFVANLTKPDSIILDSDTLTYLCRGLRDFQDEVEEKMTRLEKAVSFYINKAN